MFSQTIHTYFLKSFFFSKYLDFLKKFSILQKSKNFSMNFCILNGAPKHKTPTNLKKFINFSRKIVKILHFFLLKFSNFFKKFLFRNFSNENWYFLKNVLIIFLRNTIFLKNIQNVFPMFLRSPNFPLNSFSTLNIKNSKILIILSSNLTFSPC